MNAISPDIKRLVISRLETLPEHTSISVGAEGAFTREELLVHIEEEDNIGKKIVEAEMNFLRTLKKGIIY